MILSPDKPEYDCYDKKNTMYKYIVTSATTIKHRNYEV